MGINYPREQRASAILQSRRRIEFIMSDLYDLVNVFDENDKWLGQFIDEDTAKDWLKKHELDSSKYEISKRRPELERNK
jgi:hypothetical protein